MRAPVMRMPPLLTHVAGAWKVFAWGGGRGEKVVAGIKKGPGGRRAGAGRKKGVPNQVTTDIRQAFRNLIEKQAGNFDTWLKRVASKDPGRALDLVSRLSEYCVPKLGRTEITGANGGPLETRAITQQTDDELLRRIDQLRAGGADAARGADAQAPGAPRAH